MIDVLYSWWLTFSGFVVGQVWPFLQTNFTTSLIGAGAGAWAGAYAAQRIAERSRTREQYLKEIRNTNAATSITFFINNSLLGLKGQHVAQMKRNYDQQREKLRVFHAARQIGMIPRDATFTFQADFETLPQALFPLERLQALAFEGLSLGTRALTVAPMVIRSIHELNEAISLRNHLTEEFRESEPHTNDQMVRFYFGAPDQAGNVDARFATSIEAISRYTDACIFFCKFLEDDLLTHGNIYKTAFEKKFRGASPNINRANYAQAESRGLMPRAEDFAEWTSMFVQRPPEVH